MDDGLEILRRIMAPEGYSLTGPRQRVLGVFLKYSKPLTAAEAHRRLARKNVNLASVYRTIGLFCRLGILTQVDQVAEGRRYELSDEYREHHHHLICRGCAKIEDFEGCFLEDFEQRIRQQARFMVARHELRFLGLCRGCQR
jgi:Fur family ferric uptake transcriptional regulator